ncbi:MAG: ABC transporter permease subunit [Bacillota bacterium]|nr:ABC transporter permease subunit [Bacillota bacterium]
MIFQREFKRNMKALIIWSLILGGLVILMLSVYPQFAKDQKAMEELLKAYPEGFKKAFGMDKLNFGTLLGYYGIEIYIMTTLIGSVYAAMLGSNIVAKETGEKTIEFLLAEPVTRGEIIIQKFLAVFTNILILNLVIAVFSILGFQFTENPEVPVKAFAFLCLGNFLLHLTFGAVAFLLSSIMRRTRNIVSASLGLVFIGYFFHVMAGVSDKLKALKNISPFSYVDSAEIINRGSMEIRYVLILAAVITISIAASYVVYNKKDITI